MFSVQSSDKCASKFSMVVALVLAGLIVLSILPISLQPFYGAIHVLFIRNTAPPEYVTDKKFLSLALDSAIIADGFNGFDMRSKKLRNMIRNLSPGYLRIGGTMADQLKFISNDSSIVKLDAKKQDEFRSSCPYNSKSCIPQIISHFTMSAREWLELYDLAKDTGFLILFDLNCLLRNKDGSWNYRNGEELIRFSNDRGMKIVWQLGNEPNSYPYIFNYTLRPTQLVKDFTRLRSILDKYPLYRNKLLIGPDVTNPSTENTGSITYLKDFLADGGGDVVDAITFHQYYFNGKTVSKDDFLDPMTFDLLKNQIDIVKDLVYLYQPKPPGKSIWLSETSDGYGGGAPGYSNRYLSTFIWLDKLGVAAKMGLDVVIRQTLFKGYYALIDNQYEPTPNYWISVLYKTLVGPEVVSCSEASSDRVRLYCHCTNKKFKTSSITLFGINLKETDALIRVEGIREPRHTLDVIYSYVVSSYMTLFAKNVYLNGELLLLGPNGELPQFKPLLIDNDIHLMIPAYSLGFFVIPTEIVACH